MKQDESKFHLLTQKYPVAHMTLTLLLLTAIVAFALGFVNAQTAPVIEALQIEALMKAVSGVIPGAEGDPKILEGEWARPVKSVRESYNSAGELLGYAVEVAPGGFGGAIRMLVGLSPDGTVTGVTVLDMKETPNLGTKVRGEEFLEQYNGRGSGFKMGSGQEDVQAISGATVSSQATYEGVKAAIATVLQITEGGASE